MCVAASTERSVSASDGDRPGGLVEFSVIIPAYNVSGIIGRAIRSAAAQTFSPLEILVIDDCSTDDTVEVVRALGREIPSIRLLSTPPMAARRRRVTSVCARRRGPGSPCLTPAT